MRTGDESVKKINFLERRRDFFFFFVAHASLGRVYWTHLPRRPIWTVTGETGCTVGTHLVTKKGSSSWMAPHPDTWTSKSVRTCVWVETMTAPLPATVPASPCIRRGSLTRAPCPFTFHGYGARLYCYLQVVIFQANVNRFIIRLRGAGWYTSIRQILCTCVCSAAFFLSVLAAELQNPQPVSEVNVSFINHKRPPRCWEVQPNGLNLLRSLVGVSLFCFSSKSHVDCRPH